MTEAHLLPETTRFLVTAAALFFAVLVVAVGRSQAIIDRFFPNSAKKKSETTDVTVASAAFADGKTIAGLQHSVDKLTMSVDKLCAQQQLHEAKAEIREMKQNQVHTELAQVSKGLLDYLRMR
jgi:hypothetical protein